MATSARPLAASLTAQMVDADVWLVLCGRVCGLCLCPTARYSGGCIASLCICLDGGDVRRDHSTGNPAENVCIRSLVGQSLGVAIGRSAGHTFRHWPSVGGTHAVEPSLAGGDGAGRMALLPDSAMVVGAHHERASIARARLFAASLAISHS